MRPPGHHATADAIMGFCYLNSVAVAALHAQAALGAGRVAVWDFDAHHGNGTEDILHEREGTLYVSVHQYPGYPGTGRPVLRQRAQLSRRARRARRNPSRRRWKKAGPTCSPSSRT